MQAALVRAVVDGALVPHGPLVGPGPVGDLLRGVLPEVVGPDLRGIAAAVAFPGAVVVRGRDERELAAVGREGGVAARGEGQLLLEAALRRDPEEAVEALERRGAAGAQQDGLAVRVPLRDLIGRRVPREARGLAAFNRDGEGVQVPVVLGRERDGPAVGRELGEQLDAFAGGEALGHAARTGDGPEVTGIDEHDPVALDVGLAQQAALLERARRRGGSQQRHQSQAHNSGQQTEPHDGKPSSRVGERWG